MTVSDMTIPAFSQMLRAMGGWFEKAQAFAGAEGRDPDALRARRLAPDMYPLASQVCFTCYIARDGIHRMRGEAVPEAVEQLRAAGWAGGESPGTIADARALAVSADVPPGVYDVRLAVYVVGDAGIVHLPVVSERGAQLADHVTLTRVRVVP